MDDNRSYTQSTCSRTKSTTLGMFKLVSAVTLENPVSSNSELGSASLYCACTHSVYALGCVGRTPSKLLGVRLYTAAKESLSHFTNCRSTTSMKKIDIHMFFLKSISYWLTHCLVGSKNVDVLRRYTSTQAFQQSAVSFPVSSLRLN